MHFTLAISGILPKMGTKTMQVINQDCKKLENAHEVGRHQLLLAQDDRRLWKKE